MSQKHKSQLEVVPWPNLGHFECQMIKYSSELQTIRENKNACVHSNNE